MIATGTDAVAGRQESIGIRYADDMVTMPLQCGTQWDALGHIFNGEKMWNGYDARLVDSSGAQKNGIEKVKDRMVGRGVLLDVARYQGRATRSKTATASAPRNWNNAPPRRAWKFARAISSSSAPAIWSVA